jgi:hypothetical protein
MLQDVLLIDVVNIGNAKLYWLERDLGMSGNQYQLAVSLLFVTYVVSKIRFPLQRLLTSIRSLKRPRT